MDRSTAWDATFRIVFGLFIIGIGNAVGGFLAGTTDIADLTPYLLVVMPMFVYGMFYVIVEAGMVVEATAERTLEAAELTVEASDGDDSDEGRDSGGDRGDDTELPARD